MAPALGLSVELRKFILHIKVKTPIRVEWSCHLYWLIIRTWLFSDLYSCSNKHDFYFVPDDIWHSVLSKLGSKKQRYSDIEEKKELEKNQHLFIAGWVQRY
jgi:hypothetical protein